MTSRPTTASPPSEYPVIDHIGLTGPGAASFGLTTDDDGSCEDPMLSGTANAITSHPLDVAPLTAAATRVVIGGGVESRGTLAWRAAVATAAALGLPVTDFPGHHGGFLGGESGYRGEPTASAARLLEVLDDAPSFARATRPGLGRRPGPGRLYA